ncbi:MAG: DUF368 domain-containing protein [Cryomorphaceae bacterium]|nr:DUF368 domain-containing protein [Cryomorphaceae bacterium]
MQRITTAIKGTAMGLAEVVPGVSGGTIAFITGIYERLISSIRRIDRQFLKLILNGKVKDAYAHVDGGFLLNLILGMVIGIVVGVFGVTHLLDAYPIRVWAFFFSLIAASSFVVARDIRHFTWQILLFILGGTLFALWITSGQPLVQDKTNLVFIFLSGVLAISALLLPGLSGSFVLLLLGMYAVVIPALRDTLSGDTNQIPVVVFFALGCIVGVFTLSRLLHWGYVRFRDQVLAILTGFMLGSLNKIWPWQQVVHTTLDRNDREIVTYSKSVSPQTFSNLTENPVFGNDPAMLGTVVIMCVTFIVVISITLVSKKI